MHYENRFSTAGILAKQYKFLATDLANKASRERAHCLQYKNLDCDDNIQSSFQMKEAKRFAKLICLKKNNNSSEYQFKLLEIHPPPYSRRNIEETYSSVVLLFQKGTIHKK